MATRRSRSSTERSVSAPPPPELTNVDNEHEGAKTTHQRLKFKADFSLQNHLLLFYQSLNFGGGGGGGGC